MQNRMDPSFLGTRRMELANGDADGSIIPAARCDSTSFLMTSRIVAFVLFILGRPLNALSVVILQCMLGGTLVSPVVNDGVLQRCR